MTDFDVIDLTDQEAYALADEECQICMGRGFYTTHDYVDEFGSRHNIEQVCDCVEVD